MDQTHSLKQILSEFSIDEVPNDETGYDADVEILRPDAYEEPDSGNGEDGASSIESEEQSRNELVRHMKSLTCNPDSRMFSKETSLGRGRKRRSTDAFGATAKKTSAALAESQLEVTEVADDQDSKGPMKRARRRRRASKVADHVLRMSISSESEREENAKSVRDSRTDAEESTSKEVGDSMDLD